VRTGILSREGLYVCPSGNFLRRTSQDFGPRLRSASVVLVLPELGELRTRRDTIGKTER
jgi:hypothetical protein